MEIQKISVPRRLKVNNSTRMSFEWNDIKLPTPPLADRPKEWFVVFYNYITLNDIKEKDMFIKSDILDIEKQLLPDTFLQPPYSLAREIDELKPLVKSFTESFLKGRRQYKDYRVFYN